MGFSPGVGENFGYGQQLHNILAEIHELARAGNPPHEAEVGRIVEERFHLRYTREKPLEALLGAAKAALIRYVRENADALSRTHAVEKPFEFIDRDSGALITGVVDLLERVNDTSGDPHREAVGIIDFKAHRIRSSEDFERLRQQAERQLRLYAHAVRYAFPYEPAIATAQLVTPNPPSPELAAKGVSDRIVVDVSASVREHAIEDVRNAVAEIKQSIETQCFVRRGPITAWCPKCDFREFCPGFSEWRKRDPNTPAPPSAAEEREAEVDVVMEEQSARP